MITRDLWHRFYQNQMQIAAGRNNQFAAWADSGGLVMGHYRNSADTLRLWNLARQYTLCDNFFMAAFGGSWMNHMFLISAQPPLYPDAHKHPHAAKLLSKVEGDDPTGTRLKLADNSPASALDGPPKFVADGPLTPDGYGVNTMAPPYQPSYVPPPDPGNAAYADPADHRVMPPQGYATIGDRLSEMNIDWAWYSGAWQYALEHRDTGTVPDFQYHHQPFNYFVNYAPGTDARRTPARRGRRRAVDQPLHRRHRRGPPAGRHVLQAAGQPEHARRLRGHRIGRPSHRDRDRPYPARAAMGPHRDRDDARRERRLVGSRRAAGRRPLGPGSRIPALVISPFAKKGFVDHTLYDTNSILRFISRVHEPRRSTAWLHATRRSPRATPPGDLTNALDLG